jgi:putative colanic acid biosynthesis acetyltransferase WcaF
MSFYVTILDYRTTKPLQGGVSFPLSHRLERLVWNLVWTLAARWTPTPFFGWRRWLVVWFGGRIAPTAKIYPSVTIWYPRNLEMADYSCLGRRVNCYCMAAIKLERYALVSQDAELCAGTHDVDDQFFQLLAKPITIGKWAWIAAGAFVGPGVSVGDGAVLGARAVTVKSLDPLTIYAGNPARALRQRNINLDHDG